VFLDDVHDKSLIGFAIWVTRYSRGVHLDAIMSSTRVPMAPHEETQFLELEAHI